MRATFVLLLVLSSSFVGITASLLLACLQLPLVRYLTRCRTASQYTSGVR